MPTPAITATADQLRAASRTPEPAEPVGGLVGEPVTTPDHPTPWLAEQIRTLLAALVTGKGQICPHIGTSPRVVHAAVWRPGVLACPTCRHLLDPGPLEENTCDRCRTLTPNLNPAMAAIGPVILAFGLCDTCADVIDPTPPRRTRKPRR